MLDAFDVFLVLCPLLSDRSYTLCCVFIHSWGSDVTMSDAAANPSCHTTAIGFAYFEQLIRAGDRDQVQNELNRMKGLNDYIEKTGEHAKWIFEDMVGESFEVLEEILASITHGHAAMTQLAAKFNDPGVSAAIVYHLRLLASSWLRENADEIQPFLGGTTITSYIQNTVLPVDIEIDHMGIKALVDVLLRPANMVLEIAYLDRSPGDKVNVHRMPEEANGQDPAVLGAIIRLLYRPNHYDILYMEDNIPAQPIPMPMHSNDLQVHRATSFIQHEQIQGTIPMHDYATLDLSTLAMIPGMDIPGLSMIMPPQASAPALTGSFTPSPVSWASPSYVDSVGDASPAPMQHDVVSFPQQQQQQHMTKPMTLHPLRFSKYNYEGSPSQEPAFTTSLFKNSHFNKAHFSNDDFQPEMYSPESEEPPRLKNGTRRKSP